MKDSWLSYTVKRNWYCPNLLDFIEWLIEKNETLERMKTLIGKSKIEEPVKAKTTNRIFASRAMPNKFEYPACPHCTGKYPFGGFKIVKEKCPAQRKEPYPKARELRAH